MLHDVNFNELTAPAAGMTREEMEMCIDNLREHISEANAHWGKVAAILQADPDDAYAVMAAARTAMARIGDGNAAAAIQAARDAMPAFDGVYHKMDEAVQLEFERFNRHCDELAAMSVDDFLKFKQDRAAGLPVNRRKWRDAPERRTFWQRTQDALTKWSRYRGQA